VPEASYHARSGPYGPGAVLVLRCLDDCAPACGGRASPGQRSPLTPGQRRRRRRSSSASSVAAYASASSGWPWGAGLIANSSANRRGYRRVVFLLPRHTTVNGSTLAIASRLTVSREPPAAARTARRSGSPWFVPGLRVRAVVGQAPPLHRVPVLPAAPAASCRSPAQSVGDQPQGWLLPLDRWH
jgi:hypothetical protein